MHTPETTLAHPHLQRRRRRHCSAGCFGLLSFLREPSGRLTLRLGQHRPVGRLRSLEPVKVVDELPASTREHTNTARVKGDKDARQLLQQLLQGRLSARTTGSARA